MRHVTLKGGDKVPVLGVGTWRMGERRSERAAEVAAIKLALELGVRLVDTAEMYGEGGAEEMLSEALAGRRDQIFLVSKVYPQNASRKGVLAACERSLKRLKTDRLDLYLLHWPGSTPIEETIGAFENLRKDGKIRNWGVSNFDADGMASVGRAPNGGNCASNQVLYHLGSRGIEWRLLDACRKADVMVMAYSPLGQGPLLRKPALKAVADKHNADPAAVALAWVLRHPGVITIPKAVKPEHVRANMKALDVKLDAEDLKALEFSLSAAEAGRTAGHDLAGVAGSQPGTSPKNDKREEQGLDWFINGMEAIVGVALLAVVWVTLRLLQRRASAGSPSALGMALLPVTVLLVMVGGVVLILNGVGLM